MCKVDVCKTVCPLTKTGCVQIGGMETIQEDASCVPRTYNGMKLRNHSALGMYGHAPLQPQPQPPQARSGSADLYSQYNAFDGMSHFSGFGGGPPPLPPRHSFNVGNNTNLFDSAAAGGHLGARVPFPSRPQSRQDVSMTAPVALPPDDHSWSLTNASNHGAPPPQHSMLQNQHALNFNAPHAMAWAASQQQQQQMAHNAPNGVGASWSNSPHGSNLSRQTPSPPVPPPGFMLSSSEGPRQLLIMYTPLAHTDIAGAHFSECQLSWLSIAVLCASCKCSAIVPVHHSSLMSVVWC